MSAQILPFPTLDNVAPDYPFERLHCYVHPIIELPRAVITGVEFLVRASAEDGRIMAPAEFLPGLRERDKLTALDLRMAVKLVEFHLQSVSLSDRPLDLHLNLCPRAINNEDCVDRLVTILSAHPGLMEAVVIEIVEDPGLGAIARDHLHRLRALGARVAIDDFGAGYSNYSRLSDVAFDLIKLDRSLVERLPGSRRARSILASLISLAREIGVELIAEGIETLSQSSLLGAMGCRFGQGHSISPPFPASRMLGHLQAAGRGFAQRNLQSGLG